MKGIKVKKEVAEQMASKLKAGELERKNAENGIFSDDFAENAQNEQVKSKLQANKIEKANFYPHQKHGWFGFKLAPDTGGGSGGGDKKISIAAPSTTNPNGMGVASAQCLHRNNISFLNNLQEFFNVKSNLDDLSKKVETSSLSPKDYLIGLKQCFNADDVTRSSYALKTFDNGEVGKLRISDHKAVIKNSQRKKTFNTSIVIQLNNKRGRRKNAEVIEYVYKPENLTDDVKQDIITGIKDWMETGKFTGKRYEIKKSFCNNNMSKSLKPNYSGESKMNQTFDINITDITENNKQRKLEQFSKALTAIADNRPFVIKHISADNSKNYGNLMVRIRDFDRSKIEKAVHKVALSLDADISGASKGESFVYESQKELAERFFKDFTDKTRAVYNFVIGYFDLPDIRIVSKAGELKHKGKVLYNPTTGLPIKEADWKKFVAELEKFLNKTYAGMGGKIVLSAESLGIILDRLSKTNTLEAIRKMKLSEIKAKRYDVDWISDSVKNMKDKFGESISRERQARIQIAVDSAAQRVVRVQDDMRNNIQQIVIDGIRDKQSKSVVAQNLFDKCASLNRDMQRIADTEIQMAANSAYIQEEVYNSKPDEKVYFKRFEMLDDSTCKKCRKLKGTIALWSDVPLPDERIRDEYAKYAIWDGKNEGDCPVGVVHPWCYSDDTEVMTNNGWKLFKDVEKNDKIMSINPETREIDFVSFVKQVQYEYNGKMIHFPGRNFDLLVTPDHNMLYLARNGHGERKLKEMKACDLIKNTAFDLPRAIGEWKQTDAKTVKFGDLTISKAQYFRLWAWYLAEGSGRCRNGAYEVKLAQKDPMKIYNDLPELQSVLHVYSDSVCLLGDYARYFECMFGIYAEKKFVPPFIKNSSAENIREFLDAFVMADGSKFVNKKCSSDKAYSDVRNEQVLRTSSEKMADDLCELIVKAGWMPSEYVVKEKGSLKSFRNGDYVLNTDCHNISICHSKTRTYAPDIDGHLPRHKPTEVDYKGIVYDVELERWHFLLVRRNGKCAWSGNCRGSWIRYYPNV